MQTLRRGYTLIELLVVLGMLGLLASLSLPLAEVAAQREKERELKRALWEIRDAIDAYKRWRDNNGVPREPGESGYPPSLQALVLGLPDPKAPGGRVVFLRRVPRDPFADATLAPEQTWRLRSHASPADDPRPGADVYDISSSAGTLGLNGVPLRQW